MRMLRNESIIHKNRTKIFIKNFKKNVFSDPFKNGHFCIKICKPYTLGVSTNIQWIACKVRSGLNSMSLISCSSLVNTLVGTKCIPYKDLARSYKLMHFLQDILQVSCKEKIFLPRFFQREKVLCNILSRRKSSLEDSCKEHIRLQGLSKDKNFLPRRRISLQDFWKESISVNDWLIRKFLKLQHFFFLKYFLKKCRYVWQKCASQRMIPSWIGSGWKT